MTASSKLNLRTSRSVSTKMFTKLIAPYDSVYYWSAVTLVSSRKTFTKYVLECVNVMCSRKRSQNMYWSALMLCVHVNVHKTCFTGCLSRGGVAGPAGPAKAGPLFSRSLVSFPDCRDGLPTRWLGQVSHASSPLPSV